MTLRIDETLLTAYALNECSPEEAAEVEALLRRSPAARALVEELRELAAVAEEALLDDEALLPEQRQRILDSAAARDRLEAPALAPVSSPVLGAPPRAAKKAPRSPEEKRSHRRIWALRLSAMGAVTAVAAAALIMPLFSVMNAPGSARVARAPVPSVASRTASLEPDHRAEERRQVLLDHLEAQLHEPTDSPDPVEVQGSLEEGLPARASRRTDLGRQDADAAERAAMARRRQSRQMREPSTDKYEIPSPNGRLPSVAGEGYEAVEERSFALVTDEPLSTFSIDVDTGSYSNVRRFLEHHTLPPPSAVRIEELLNYFDYAYAPPSGDAPFATHVEIASCPWNPQHRLARIGLQGQVIADQDLPPSNLVFLIDVSGSMSSDDKLPLVQRSIRLLVDELDERDRLAIVVYAGASGLVLPSTSGEDSRIILRALDRLKAGGGTHGSAGIELAYQVAVDNFIEGGANRVILASDGDFNVGITDRQALLGLIEDRARSGVFLTVLGFGTGNLQDATMEQLADHGNGHYAYIDSIDEARKVLVTQRAGSTTTIAKDVKIQVEFNPREVHAYRLIGYENRALAARDFADDTKDAGEIGAGHSVTALYEIVPAGTDLAVPGAPILKYQQPQATTAAAASGELMTVKLRYKQPDGDRSQLLSFPVRDGGTAWSNASADFQHAAAVAAFGMLLRGSKAAGEADWELVRRLAQAGRARDPHRYRWEFSRLVEHAAAMQER